MFWQWKSFKRATDVALFLQQIGDERARQTKVSFLQHDPKRPENSLSFVVFYPSDNEQPEGEDYDGIRP